MQNDPHGRLAAANRAGHLEAGCAWPGLPGPVLCALLARLQANDMNHVRGHAIEWYYQGDPTFVNHFSRNSTCANYRFYLRRRAEQIAVRGRLQACSAHQVYRISGICVLEKGGCRKGGWPRGKRVRESIHDGSQERQNRW